MFESIGIGNRDKAKAIVFGHFQGEKLDERTRQVARKLGVLDAADAVCLRPEATGESGVIAEGFVAGGQIERVLVVGLGKKDTYDAAGSRGLGAAIGRRLASVKATTARVEIEPALKGHDVDSKKLGAAFGESVGLLGWVCDEFRGKATDDAKRVPLALNGGSAGFETGLQRGLDLAISTNLTRTLSQTPPNVATPEWMAQQAQKLAKDHGLGFKIWKGADLDKEKFVGLVNVGKASENKPCMVRLEYTPKGAKKDDKPIVLIGKTMTYDTGGLSLKVNNGMVGMKRDKDGGCAVLGAMHAIATVIQPRKRVVALLAIAENSVSDEAYRPDDVIRYRNGVTVEITNTDAEGRLVLADALCWACEKENPASIIDLATLTGGVVVALGSTYCGMFCDDDRLRGKIEAASAASGERVWRLPMHAEYRDMMKSPIADILNSNPNRKAHPIQGAAFLSYFVEEKVPWCHLDIAGVHVSEGNKGMFVEGPTGWGVRLLASYVEKE